MYVGFKFLELFNLIFLDSAKLDIRLFHSLNSPIMRFNRNSRQLAITPQICAPKLCPTQVVRSTGTPLARRNVKASATQRAMGRMLCTAAGQHGGADKGPQSTKNTLQLPLRTYAAHIRIIVIGIDLISVISNSKHIFCNVKRVKQAQNFTVKPV